MILQTANLTAAGSAFSGEEPVDVFEWEDRDGEIVFPASPMRWRFTAKLFGSELLVEGKASADFKGICARCGRDMALTVSEPLCFSREVDDEISEVDLTSEIRDAILLALPNHPVCDPGCKGLCPKCGKPISESPCKCHGPSGSSAWDVLDNFSPPRPPTLN